MSRGAATSAENRLGWVAGIRAIALLWIILNHVVERLFGYPYFANPSEGWPDMAERIAQMQPLPVEGLAFLPLNAIRYVGWLGDQGVQLFLIVSGFGLTWGLLRRGAPDRLPLGEFFRKRAARILPLWWASHLLFIATWWWIGWGMSLEDPRTVWSFLGVRITPSQFYYFSPAWWYIGLLIQLYLVYPWLWSLLRRRGPILLLGAVGGTCLVIRAAGLLAFEGYLDVWQRGGIFVSRLPEFLVGMALAWWYHQNADAFRARLRSPGMLALAAAAWAAGFVLSFSLLGMTVAPLLLGAGGFVLLHGILPANPRGTGWLGRHDYSVYLLHHPVILIVLPSGARNPVVILIGMALVTVGLVITSPILDRVTSAAQHVLGRVWRRSGLVPAASLAVLVLAAIFLPPVAAELAVRQWDPQEVDGWGERPALEPHEEFGWRLIPSRTTRLRWVTYDYEVTANSLGFPGPEPIAPRPPGSFRVVTTGDAFTSAEGVDTARAWPRLLEEMLAERNPDRPVEVINLAMTGYGPQQELAVLERFVPELEPDLVVLEFFVNDFKDVLSTNERFQDSIGFEDPAPEGFLSVLRRGHLDRLVEVKVMARIREVRYGDPNPDGVFLGQLAALERRDDEESRRAASLVEEHLARMRDLTAENRAEFLIVLVPASVQVCDPADLDYFPGAVSLDDTEQFDLDRPQRIMTAVADRLDIRTLDLREALRAAPECPYFSGNMHWTEAAHRISARVVTDHLLQQEP